MKYGAFMLRLNAPGFKGCIVKQCPEKSESSFMLFMKTPVANYSCEFKDYRVDTMSHLLESSITNDKLIDMEMVIIDNAPLISSFSTLWTADGCVEIFTKKIHPYEFECELQKCLKMLCISVQVSGGSKSTHAMTRRSQLK